MTVTTTHTVTHTLTVDDLPFDAVLAHEPDTYIDPVVTKREDGTYTVPYAVYDESGDAPNPIEDYDTGIEFEEFNNATDRDQYYHDTDLSTHVPFIVDHFEHSSHAYTLAGTLEHLGMYYAFDSRPSGVLRVPVDFTNHEEAARSILKEYTSWVNGETYGVVRQDFDAEGNETSEDACWGFIGSEYTEEVVKDIDSHL